MKGSRWTVGRDSKISFWNGNWTKKGPIRQLIQGPLTQEALALEIKDVIQDSGWNWSKLPFDFPLDCKLMLQAILISHLGRGCDRIAWADNPKGIFDLKSAYGIAMGDDTSMAFNADWIWKLKTLPRIQFFLWKCAHNSIGVKDCLVGRGMGNDNQCAICHGGAESILHALKDCPQVQSIWRQLGV